MLGPVPALRFEIHSNSFHGLNCAILPNHFHFEAQTLIVTVFGDRAWRKVIKLSEDTRVRP